MDVLVLITHRQQITTKTQIGKWVERLCPGDHDRQRQGDGQHFSGEAVLCMGNTWRNVDPTTFTPLSTSGHRIDCTAFGRKRLDKAEIETCYELGKSLQPSTQCDHVPVHVQLPPARRWRRVKDRNPSCPRWNHAALRRAMRDESPCEAYRDSVEQALKDSNIVNSDLPLVWFGDGNHSTSCLASLRCQVNITTSSLDDPRSME